MSPTALTATIARDDEPVRQRDGGRADPGLHGMRRPVESACSTRRPSCRRWRPRRRRRCLPPRARPSQSTRPCSRSRRSAGSSGRRRTRDRTGSPPGTIGTTPAADLVADVVLLEIPHDALCRVEPEGAAAGQHDRVDLVHHVQRIEEIRFARARRAAALRHAARRRRPRPRGSPCSPVGRSVSVKWPTLMPSTAVRPLVGAAEGA